MSATFSVHFRKAIPTLRIFSLLGILGAAAAVINATVTDNEPKQPWALVVLILGLPGIWIVTVICLAAFSLRITDEKVEKLFANRWVVASKPLDRLSSASIAQNTLLLGFLDGTEMRLAAMPLRDEALLARVLADRCPQVKLS